MNRIPALLLISLCLMSLAVWSQSAAPQSKITVAANGTVQIPAQAVPPSSLLSPEAKAYVAQHLLDMQNPAATYMEKGIPNFMRGYLDRQRVLYPAQEVDTTIGNVHALVFSPSQNVAQKNSTRVLINLHGGGFGGCWPGCARLESLPISSVGGIQVISIDYRESPEYKFPAASEDVAAVYRALLEKYPAHNIGIYGCSAGGILTGMSVAWFQQHHLPAPGAVGIFCAGIGEFGKGDTSYTAMPLGEARLPANDVQPVPPLPYLANADPADPLVFQATHPDVLAQFPPTLIITGTRDFALSSALNSHLQLRRAGADSQLLVWDGLFHGFFYNPDVPESKDAYALIWRFFDQHLGTR